ncbi:MAG: hypothetical protein Q9162_007569, partial [Coniocarpon cinnabarinum]
LNAGLTERFGRGPAFKQRNQSQQTQQPIHKANVEVQRYFSKARVGVGAPRWTTRPEVPTPEELLPYPSLPMQPFMPNTSNSHGWYPESKSDWNENRNQAAVSHSDQNEVGITRLGTENATSWQDNHVQGDAWATESKATEAWSTQPASGDDWHGGANDHVWATQETGDAWENDAWINSNLNGEADAWPSQGQSSAVEDSMQSHGDETTGNEDDFWGCSDSPAVKSSVNDNPVDKKCETIEEDNAEHAKQIAEPTETDLDAASSLHVKVVDTGSSRDVQDGPSDFMSEARSADVWNGEESIKDEWNTEGPQDDAWTTHADANASRSIPAGTEQGWGTAVDVDPLQSTNNGITTTHEEDDTFERFENVSNIIQGPWPSKIDYLRSHYLLLREDALRPLREAVEHVRSMTDLNENPSRATVGIYDQVQVCGITFANRGLGIRVKFSLGRVGKNIYWSQSKRLIAGTLVVLMSPDRSICKVATVAARPLELLEKNPPEVDLFFGRAEDLDVDSSQDWIMIEERGSFFEAQRHTLVALQRMVDEKFPLQEHLVDLQTSIRPPPYIEKSPVRDLRPISSQDHNQQVLKKVDVLQEWPSNIHPHLDESQMNALKTILTKRLSIVQGPPGTGKTYVSVEALKVMLQNLCPDDPPIVITCQTNHALDQLLGHVALFEPSYVRIGSRSSSEVVKKRTLYELKRDRKPPPFKAMQTWRKLESQISKLIAPLIKAPAGPESKDTFDLELLRELGVLSNEQCDSVIEGAKVWVSYEEDADERPLLKWIGKQLEPVRPRHQPLLVGYEEIDEGNIGFEEVLEQEAEQVVKEEDDEMEGLKGTFWPIGDTWTGRALDNAQARNHARELLKNYTDLWKIRTPDRGNVYRHIQREAKIKITNRLRQLFPEYEKACLDRKVHRFEHEETILKENKVIGLTTTGVSKYRGLIASLQPKIVLIEEAAETLEGPVIAACLESVEHLVLVGDHKQLRPNCHVMELQKPPFNLNISLFERLVNNDVNYSVLARQRRMKPEIRRLLKPIYGNAVRDHKSVQKLAQRPPVPGMGGLTTWFFTHEYPDERDQECSSFNTLEAEMILGLVQYLHYNGVAADQITILTFYNGQRRLIRRLFAEDEKARGNADLRMVQLVTVDSYQGEENAIVILSLVRSNIEGKIGFIGVDNRVCVALSRAQRGFYIFGNAQLLCNESWLWSEMITLLFNGYACTPTKNEERLQGPELNKGLPKDRRIGYHLPLWCKRHQRQFWVFDPNDWKRNTPCECAKGCHEGDAVSNVKTSPPNSPPQSTTADAMTSVDDLAEKFQQFARDCAAEDAEARKVADATPQDTERLNAQRQQELDDENARLLFMDDASQVGAKHKLVNYQKAEDGSVTRTWQFSYQSKPQRQATVAAEQQFLSLLDQ